MNPNSPNPKQKKSQSSEPHHKSRRSKTSDKKDIQISQNYFINQININNLKNKLPPSHPKSSKLRNTEPLENPQNQKKKRTQSSKKERKKSKNIKETTKETSTHGKSFGFSHSFLSIDYKKKFLNFLEKRRKKELSLGNVKNNFMTSPEIKSSKLSRLLSNAEKKKVNEFFVEKKNISDFNLNFNKNKKKKSLLFENNSKSTNNNNNSNLNGKKFRKMKSFKTEKNPFNNNNKRKMSKRSSNDLMSLTLNQKFIRKPQNLNRNLGSFSSNYNNLKQARKSIRLNFLKKLKNMKGKETSILGHPVKESLARKEDIMKDVVKKLNFSEKKKKKKSKRKIKGGAISHKRSSSFDVALFVRFNYIKVL